MAKRYNYVIGDVQGCYAALQALLEDIKFDPKQDVLWFTGDLVARGEDSLSVLRLIYQLSQQGAAKTVLGNHDFSLLASWRGYKTVKAKDKVQPILDAPDVDELLNWLRYQPVVLFPTHRHLIVHAGVPPMWSVMDVMQYASELSQIVSSAEIATLDSFLSQMYGDSPNVWQDELVGFERLRVITNYFTRMRLLDSEHGLEFSFKAGLDDPMPAGFKPWFTQTGLVEKSHQILFGHWAALVAKPIRPQIRALDGGSVWGGQMIAYRLEDEQTFAVSNPLVSLK